MSYRRSARRPHHQSGIRRPLHCRLQRGRHTVFIDRHLPKSFRWLTKTVRVDPLVTALPDDDPADHHHETATSRNVC
jgi:hypothetical protein